MSNEIEKIFAFIIEIDKLKNILRKTRPVGLDRYENSAEHSWHVCLAALMLKDYSNETIDIDRVIRMLLIHDLGEVDTGDTIVFLDEQQEIKSRESDCIHRLFRFLPPEKFDEFVALWKEFEFGETADAKFARAIDRITPVLHNLHGNLHSWKENNIPVEKVIQVNSSIKHGSEKLWEIIESKLNRVATSGALDRIIE